MMTLDEAIERYTNNAEYERTHGSLQGCLEFRQLAEWLKELKENMEVLDQIRAEIKAMFPPSGSWMYEEGHEVEHTVCEVLADVIAIIDKYRAESEGRNEKE